MAIKQSTIAALRIVAWAVMGAACAVGGWYAADIAPVRVTDLRETGGVAVRGGTLELLARVDRTRSCPARPERWLWQWITVDGKQVKKWIEIPEKAAPPVEVGEDEFVVVFDIPTSATPGEWHYLSVTQDQCGGILPGHVRVSPDFVFPIEPSSAPVAVKTPLGPITILPEGKQ